MSDAAIRSRRGAARVAHSGASTVRAAEEADLQALKERLSEERRRTTVWRRPHMILYYFGCALLQYSSW